MTTRRRPRTTDAAPADVAALAAEVAALRATVTTLVGDLVEQGEAIRELRARQDHSEPVTGDNTSEDRTGLEPLKAAMAHADGLSDETVRLWLSAGDVQGKLIGGRWFVSVRSLQEHVGVKRSNVA